MIYTLENYSFGRVTINGRTHTRDLLIQGDHIIPDWRRKEGHSLAPEDIEHHLLPNTRVLIIGCGSPGMLVVPESTASWCKAKGITLLSAPTREACVQYNEMAAQESWVMAGLHLTC